MSTTAAADPRNHTRPPLVRLAAWLGVVGGTLGLIAGLVELTAGGAIRSWVGDKNDTTRLGLATILLALIALTAALALLTGRAASPQQRLAVSAGLLLPGLICFTTVGRLWYLPGAMLVGAGLGVAVGLRKETYALAASLERNWTALLTAVLAAFYIFLGATALGLPGALGIVGGLLVFALLASREKTPTKIDRHVAVTFANGPHSVTATLVFNEDDELVDFVSDDRPDSSTGTFVPRRWNTPISHYQEVNGLRLPTRGSAVYAYPDGPFTYGAFEFRSITYDLAAPATEASSKS